MKKRKEHESLMKIHLHIKQTNKQGLNFEYSYRTRGVLKKESSERHKPSYRRVQSDSQKTALKALGRRKVSNLFLPLQAGLATAVHGTGIHPSRFLGLAPAMGSQPAGLIPHQISQHPASILGYGEK